MWLGQRWSTKIQPAGKEFSFAPGPIFSNVSPMKLIGLLQRHRLPFWRQWRKGSYRFWTDPSLDAPFFVLATQNPIELEGTYPLPEAQLDRFLLNPVIQYLSISDEIQMVGETTG